MYNIEIHSTFHCIIGAFYEFGLWHNEEKSTFRKNGRRLFYLLNMILFQILLVTCACFSDDKSESVFLVQVEISAIVMAVKLIYLLWKKDTILEMLSTTMVAHSISDHVLFMQVNKKITKFMKFVHVYLVMIAVIVFILIISPLPIFSVEKKLPLSIPFSLDCKYSEIIYWLTYAFLTFQICLIAVVNLLTVIIWYVMLNCSIKYQILGNQFRRLGVRETKPTETDKPEEDDLYHQDLVCSIGNHQNIFEYNFVTLPKCFSNL